MSKGCADSQLTIRTATLDDGQAIQSLLLRKAVLRQTADPDFWTLAKTPGDQIRGAFHAALTQENPPFRQIWQVAERAGTPIGVNHSMLLPVPPIYAGEFGPPGLILDDSGADADQPAEMMDALLDAAEAKLKSAGARILVAAAFNGSPMESAILARGYPPLTLYLSRTGLGPRSDPQVVRLAGQDDVSAIVKSSAIQRATLYELNDFWKTHPQADPRFHAWMAKSLTFADRDMQVLDGVDGLTGYVISQPASGLHIPPAHEVASTGFIDDFFDQSLHPADAAAATGPGAADLIGAAESRLAGRGFDKVFVVCPAAWRSKRALLESLGYRVVLTWYGGNRR